MNEYLEKMNVDTLKFEVLTNPYKIGMMFAQDDNSSYGSKQVDEVIQKMDEACNRKIMLLDKTAKKAIENVSKKIKLFHTYLFEWREQLNYSDYYTKRLEKYKDEIHTLQQEVPNYLNQQTKESKEKVIAILKDIETRELSQIYGGSILTFNNTKKE